MNCHLPVVMNRCALARGSWLRTGRSCVPADSINKLLTQLSVALADGLSCSFDDGGEGVGFEASTADKRAIDVGLA